MSRLNEVEQSRPPALPVCERSGAQEPRVPSVLIADAFVAFVDGLALDRVVEPERNARISFDVFWLAMLGLTD